MTTLKLTRLNEPNIEKLYEMKSTLRNILEEGDFENLNTILDFHPLIKSLQMQGLTSAMSQHTSAHPFS